jgi:hypothetical protein
MSPSKDKSKLPKVSVSTAEAFYRIFCVLPRKDRLKIVQYILQDKEIKKLFNLPENPNEVTLKAFQEDKKQMPVFESIQELREDLLL